MKNFYQIFIHQDETLAPEIHNRLLRLSCSKEVSYSYDFSTEVSWKQAIQILDQIAVPEIPMSTLDQESESMWYHAYFVPQYSTSELEEFDYFTVITKFQVDFFGFNENLQFGVWGYPQDALVASLKPYMCLVSHDQKFKRLIHDYAAFFDVTEVRVEKSRVKTLSLWRPKHLLGDFSKQMVTYHNVTGKLLDPQTLNPCMDVRHKDRRNSTSALFYPKSQLDDLKSRNIDAAVTSQLLGAGSRPGIGGYLVVSKRLWHLLRDAGLVNHALPVEFVDE